MLEPRPVSQSVYKLRDIIVYMVGITRNGWAIEGAKSSWHHIGDGEGIETGRSIEYCYGNI